ncbi:hypothetical protein [Aliikangiella maris]|uniref:Uncharacterized protein n=2 Tax=Aliikangiella maris TaxID=3162458 RepID=A0ABV2BZZ8_9GAMM
MAMLNNTGLNVKKILIILSVLGISIAIWGGHAFLLSDSSLLKIATNRLEIELNRNPCKSLSKYQVLRSKGYKVVSYGWLCKYESNMYYYYSISVLGNGSTELYKLSLDENEKNEFYSYFGD